MVAVAGSVLVAMAGLATEGSLLYLARRDAQHGADLAALAAASAYQFRGRAAALAAGQETGVRNGFAASAITVSNPPTSGAGRGDSNAFEVRITRQIPIAFARVLSSAETATVTGRAVSLLHGTTPACLVALTGGVTIQNSSSFDSTNCAVGSNAPGASVSIPQSNSSVKARAVVAFGTCSGCSNTRWSLAEGYQEHAAPLSNPYSGLDDKAQPVASGASCLNTAALNTNQAIKPTGTSKAYCASVNISNTSAVSLSPGTYVFQNASLTVGGIASFACNGCTFIFRGTNPGNLSLSNTSSVTLSAPATNKDDSDYDGIVIYRAKGGTVGNSGNPNLNLQNTSSFNVTGGIYAPDSYVKIGQVSSNATASCLALVGGTLDISGLSSFRFDVSQCGGAGTSVPMARVVRLLE